MGGCARLCEKFAIPVSITTQLQPAFTCSLFFALVYRDKFDYLLLSKIDGCLTGNCLWFGVT